MRDDEDEALLTAYVAGDLDEAGRFACEQRLASDPEFARRLLAFEAVDLLAAAVREAEAIPAPRRGLRASRGLVVAVVAAAAAAAAMVAFWLSAAPAIACTVRVLASHGGDDFARYADGVGLPAGVRYAGALRSEAGAAAGLSAEAFVVAVAQREGARAQAAFAAPQQPVGDAFFTVRLQVDRSCHALVLQTDSTGRWRRRFPSPMAPVFGELANPLSAGTHTLPRPVVLPNPIGTLSLHPGFATPAAAAAPVPLVLALTATPITASAWAELDRVLEQAGAMPTDDPTMPPPVVRWLAEHGCSVHTLPVTRS
jgi:hypothetical protein